MFVATFNEANLNMFNLIINIHVNLIVNCNLTLIKLIGKPHIYTTSDIHRRYRVEYFMLQATSSKEP